MNKPLMQEGEHGRLSYGDTMQNIAKKKGISAEDRSKALELYRHLRTNNLFCVSGRFVNLCSTMPDLRDFLTMIAYASHGDTENKTFFVSEECIGFECRAGRPTVVASRKRLLAHRAPWETPALVEPVGPDKGYYCCGGWYNGPRITLPSALVRGGWLRYLGIKAKRMVARIVLHTGQHITAAIVSPAVGQERDEEACDRMRPPYYGTRLEAFRYLPPSAVTALESDMAAYEELYKARMLVGPEKVFSGPVEGGLVLVMSPPDPTVDFLRFLLFDHEPARAAYKAQLKRKREARSKMAKLKADLEALWPTLEPCS